jgi:hypothetical protein
MGTRAAKVGTTISARGQDSLVCPESVQCAVFHVKRNNTDTFAILHNQVKSEELDEKVGVMAEGLAVKGVEKGMACTVNSSSTTICLSAFSIFERLATKSTLVNFSFFCS